MARRTRVELAGGLYHVITRGNNRQTIFKSHDDFQKFLSLLEIQKHKLPYFLFANRRPDPFFLFLMATLTDEVGRRQKVYSDVIGRQWKTEILNTNGSVYSTSVSVFNARDQVTLVRPSSMLTA